MECGGIVPIHRDADAAFDSARAQHLATVPAKAVSPSLRDSATALQRWLTRLAELLWFTTVCNQRHTLSLDKYSRLGWPRFRFTCSLKQATLSDCLLPCSGFQIPGSRFRVPGSAVFVSRLPATLLRLRLRRAAPATLLRLRLRRAAPATRLPFLAGVGHSPIACGHEEERRIQPPKELGRQAAGPEGLGAGLAQRHNRHPARAGPDRRPDRKPKYPRQHNRFAKNAPAPLAAPGRQSQWIGDRRGVRQHLPLPGGISGRR